jgi:hypothetical protein
LQSEATARTDLHAIKYALLFAVLDQKQRIGLDHVSRAIALATFNMDVASSVVGSVGLSRVGVRERKLLTILKNGRMSTREAMRRLHLSAEELDRLARALERMGEIEIRTESTPANRRRVFLELT